jgi:outer membrane receptor protein involved in Fe transport
LVEITNPDGTREGGIEVYEWKDYEKLKQEQPVEPVGIFVDGVYRSRAGAALGDLPNLKRVEILRGPQSTLFGKNASAGVISLVTAEPQYEFGGGAEISYGNYNATVVRANVTGPIADNVAVSVEGNYNKGIIGIVQGDYANAVSNFGDNKTFNKALVV